MTPLVAAKHAYEYQNETVGDGHLVSLQAACLAYVRALSEDEGTVEKVAEAMCADPSTTYENAARYFLRVLATKEPTP